jgi:hypothetical protein
LVVVSGCAGPTGTPSSGSQDSTQDSTSTFHLNVGIERQIQAADLADSQPFDQVENHVWNGSWPNGYWFAKVSDIAFRNPVSQLQSDLASVGLPVDPNHFAIFENTCTNARAYYVTTADLTLAPEPLAQPDAISSDMALLVFRGTQVRSAADDLADIDTLPTDSPLGRIHEGFSHHLNSVWVDDGSKDNNGNPCLNQAIVPFLQAHHTFQGGTRAGAELYIVGESLGAAMATVAFARTVTDPCEAAGEDPNDPTAQCLQTYTPVSALITYGSPRVGEAPFAHALVAIARTRATAMVRVVYRSDPVPDMPPLPFVHISDPRPPRDGIFPDDSSHQVYIRDPNDVLVSQWAMRPLVPGVPDHLAYTHVLATMVGLTDTAAPGQ